MARVSFTYRLKSIPEGSQARAQGRNLEAETVGELLAQLIFIYDLRLPAQRWHCPEWTRYCHINL